MLRKIKIKICDYDNGRNENSYGNFLVSILKKYYEVELSENPDYLFYNESTCDYLKYNCVRIFYTGENISPNFNLCDYSIDFDYMDFEDRHYRLPLYLLTPVFFVNMKDRDLAGDTDFSTPYIFTRSELAKKTSFCSFVYSNYLADDTREAFFNKLSLYKKVNAGGKYLNNVGEKVASKLEFEMKHKFSIAFENSSRSGYTTEKIVNSLSAKTIPIYFGNPNIHKEFNEKRFINCHRYKNFDEVIDRVKEIDNNDNLYLSIINEPVTITEFNFKEVRKNFEIFLKNIIDQPIISAKRAKINLARKTEFEKNEKIIANLVSVHGVIKKILAKIYQPFKKINILEDLKQKYFRKKSLKKC